MSRKVLGLWLLTVVVAGCARKNSSGEVELILKMPLSSAAPGRFTSFTVDGVNYGQHPPGQRHRTLRVKPGDVTIAYGYFPDDFTSAVRSGTVRVGQGERVTVDLTGSDFSETQQGVCELVLLLPETILPPSRKASLKIDGADRTDPNCPRDQVVAFVPRSDKATVSYGHWPNIYTEIIRTRVVPVHAGQSVKVDLRHEDRLVADEIRATYVPTPWPVVHGMCELARVGKKDVVYDIGCGDGRLVIAAVNKFGATRGVGLDINFGLIKDSRKHAVEAGVEGRTEFRQGDALKITDLSEASVVFLYLGEDLNLKLRPVLKKTLRPGSRIVSHAFLMGDWKPEASRTIRVKGGDNIERDFVVYLWTIGNSQTGAPRSGN